MFLLTFLTFALAVASVKAQNCLAPAMNVYKSCTTPNTAALTFDDGPYLWLNDIVDQLDKVGGKGTFFVNGLNWDCIYNQGPMARLKYAYDKGHMIGSHTWSHLDLANLAYDRVNDEMARTELAIQRITGALVGFTRTPYGSESQTVFDVAANRSQKLVTWDFDAQDGVGVSPNETKSLYDAAINLRAGTGTILTVNHETHETTVKDVLPYVISRLQSSGYKLVTVAECLGLSPYQRVDPPGTPNTSWTC